MEYVPSKQLFSYLPEKTSKNGCLEGWLKMNLLVWYDFIDQKEHPKHEEEWYEIFQAKSSDGSNIPEEAESIALNERNKGSQRHAYKQKDPCQKNHEEINCFPSEESSSLLYLKNCVEGYSQRTENPCGRPDEPTKAQYSNNLSITNDRQHVFHYARI